MFDTEILHALLIYIYLMNGLWSMLAARMRFGTPLIKVRNTLLLCCLIMANGLLQSVPRPAIWSPTP